VLILAVGGGAGAWLKARLLRQLCSQEMEEEGKENSAPKSDLNKESAAVVIQSCKCH
jgi:hypothetical protein